MHLWVKKFVGRVQSKLLLAGYPISEIAIHDIMAKRFEDEFDVIDWKDEKQVNKFVEGLIADIEEIKSKDVKVKMRSIPRSEINVK